MNSEKSAAVKAPSDRSSLSALIGVLSFFVLILLMCAGAAVSLISDESVVENGIGVVEIKGTIANADPIVKNIQDFMDDDQIRAILIRIDSPGGSVSASQEMVEAIQSITKPAVISMGDMAASGGYYVACAGPKIFASPGTLTGSIGVISQVMEFKDLMAFFKINVHTIKTGDLKDAGSPYREFDEKDRAYFTQLGLEILDQFVEHVAQARHKTHDEIAKHADGRVWSGREAKKLGLIDELGGMHAAIKQLKIDAHIVGKHTLVYPKKSTDTLLEELLTTGASAVSHSVQSSVQRIAADQNVFEYKLPL